MTSLSPSIDSAMGTAQDSFRYLDLPAEIRNQVMEYILLPGDVHLHVRAREAQDPGQNLTESSISPAVKHTLPAKLLSAYNFLAVCRQIRAEGEHLFHGSNIFYLPPGQAANTTHWLRDIGPQHRDMIKMVCMTMTPEDIPPQPLSPRLTPWMIRNHFRDIWWKKLDFLKCCSSLELIHFKAPAHWISVKAPMDANYTCSEDFRPLEIEICSMFVEASRAYWGVSCWTASRT